MSAVRLPKSWMLGAACALAVTLCSVAGVQAGDYLKKFKPKEQLDNQKVVADVQELLNSALKVRATSPQQARTYLQDGLFRLDNAANLNETERGSLRKQIQQQLQQLEVVAREQAAEAELAAQRAEAKAAKALREKAQQGGGTTGKGAFDQAKGMIDNSKKVLSTYNDIKLKREKGIVDVTMDIHRTNAQMTEEPYTKYFFERANKRMESKYTKAEKELLKALNSTMSVDFKMSPLKEAIEYLQDKTGINVSFDEVSLKENDVNYETDMVSLKLNKVTVRTILKKILADKGLTFVIKEAAIQVMNHARAKEQVVVRSYPVQDLVQSVATLNGNPYMQRAQMYQAVNGLIANIMATVEPGTWQANGGSGAITFHEPSMSLVIRQTAEFHYQMGGVLGR